MSTDLVHVPTGRLSRKPEESPSGVDGRLREGVLEVLRGIVQAQEGLSDMPTQELAARPSDRHRGNVSTDLADWNSAVARASGADLVLRAVAADLCKVLGLPEPDWRDLTP